MVRVAGQKLKVTPELLKRAMQGEQDTIEFYKRLSEMTDDRENKEIIGRIIADERRHFDGLQALFRQLYRRNPPPISSAEPKIKSFRQGSRTAVLEELDTYEFYRNIYLGNYSSIIKNFSFEAMTDECGHAVRFNYICGKLPEPRTDTQPRR